MCIAIIQVSIDRNFVQHLLIFIVFWWYFEILWSTITHFGFSVCNICILSITSNYLTADHLFIELAKSFVFINWLALIRLHICINVQSCLHNFKVKVNIEIRFVYLFVFCTSLFVWYAPCYYKVYSFENTFCTSI